MKRVLVIALLSALAACDSPEAARTRGGGPGADTGNRGEVVRMHEGSKPFAGTPDFNPGKSAPTDSAQHAYSQSRP